MSKSTCFFSQELRAALEPIPTSAIRAYREKHDCGVFTAQQVLSAARDAKIQEALIALVLALAKTQDMKVS